MEKGIDYAIVRNELVELGNKLDRILKHLDKIEGVADNTPEVKL